MKRLAGLIAAAMVSVACFASQTEARVVAILFDTSGSMESIYRLPAFGMQLLAGTLDGRAGADRLLTLNFDTYANEGYSFEALGPANLPHLPPVLREAVRTYEISSQATHQDALDGIGADFRAEDPNRGTPYGPIEIILGEAARAARPGEEVVIVVISDGEYNDDALAGGHAKAELTARFQEYRAAFSGPVHAEYLFIASPGDAQRLRDGLKDQGVRDAFLEAFNGPDRDPAGELKGARFVTDSQALWAALREIVGEVSGVDLTQQAQWVGKGASPDSIAITSPLSISRIVVVSTAVEGVGAGVPVELANFAGDLGKASEKRKVEVVMRHPDSGLENASPRRGLVQQLWFQTTLAPGRHDMTFTGPVSEDSVFLLFQTAAIARLVLIDPDTGNEVLPDATGRRRLAKGHDYLFAAQVLDGAVPQTVPLSALSAGLSMFLQLDGPERRVDAMSMNPAADRGEAGWVAGDVGLYSARAQVRIPGFVSPFSEPVEFEVIDNVAQITLSPVPPDPSCAGCNLDEITSTVTPGETESVVMRFDVGADAQTDGAISFADSVLPPGFEIRDESGGTVDLRQALPFAAGETRRYAVVRTGQASAEDVLSGAQALSITASPAQDWAGSAAQLQTRVALVVGDLVLKLDSVSRPPQGGPADMLEVPGGDLLTGQFGASFSMTGLLEQPDPAAARDHVTVAASGLTGRLLRFEPLLSAPGSAVHALEIRPSTRFWCLCGIGIENLLTGTDVRNVTVSYRDRAGLQSAEAGLKLSVPVPALPFGLSCALNLFALLLMAMFLRGIVALVTTKRFPRGSSAEITDGDSPPRYQRLDRKNSVWWKAWFALFTGNPDEMRKVEGMRLKATFGGALLDLSKSAPAWTSQNVGESFVEVKKNRPHLTEYRLDWGDVLHNDLDPGRTVRLKRRSGDM